MIFLSLAAVVLLAADDHSKELFHDNCSACHVAPDPAFDTDKAWIRQLEETT